METGDFEVRLESDVPFRLSRIESSGFLGHEYVLDESWAPGVNAVRQRTLRLHRHESEPRRDGKDDSHGRLVLVTDVVEEPIYVIDIARSSVVGASD
jgi:hypothetical protein